MIEPEQWFRDGFKLAGDDMLLQIVQKQIVPAIEAALARTRRRRASAAAVAADRRGEPGPVQARVLRQQFALQVLMPVGLAHVHATRSYDPLQGADLVTLPIARCCRRMRHPHQRAIDYFATGVRQAPAVRRASTSWMCRSRSIWTACMPRP